MSRRLTNEEKLDRAVLERDLQDQIIQLARLLRWRVAHFRPAMTAQGWRTPVQADGKGFPDLILLRGSRIVVVEVKRQLGTIDPDQELWLDAFRGVGAEVHVWRPSDMRSGSIQRELGNTLREEQHECTG